MMAFAKPRRAFLSSFLSSIRIRPFPSRRPSRDVIVKPPWLEGDRRQFFTVLHMAGVSSSFSLASRNTGVKVAHAELDRLTMLVHPFLPGASAEGALPQLPRCAAKNEGPLCGRLVLSRLYSSPSRKEKRRLEFQGSSRAPESRGLQ